MGTEGWLRPEEKLRLVASIGVVRHVALPFEISRCSCSCSARSPNGAGATRLNETRQTAVENAGAFPQRTSASAEFSETYD